MKRMEMRTRNYFSWRYNNCSSILIGLSLGVALSLVLTPLIDEDCVQIADGHYSGVRSLQSEFDNGAAVVEGDDYEPRLNLEGKPKSQSKEVTPLVRPRFYSTELGIKDKLFVGILLDDATNKDLVSAINVTLAHHVDRLVFFVPAANRFKTALSRLPSVVDLSSTPRLLEPFQMLSHVGQRHQEDYDFFFLVRAGTYVHGASLRAFVEGISMSRRVHLGKQAAGLPYCDLGAGILFSKSVMTAVTRDLKWGMLNAFSDDESANLGRCILHATSLPCAGEIDGNMYLSARLGTEDDPGKGVVRTPVADGVLTVRPAHKPDVVLGLHAYFIRLALMETRREIRKIRESIADTEKLVPDELKAKSWPIGIPPPSSPKSRFAVIPWDCVTESRIYPEDDFGALRNLTAVEMQDLKEVVDAAAATLKRTKRMSDAAVIFRNGYRRFDPTRGMEYLLDLMAKDPSSGKETVYRMEALRPLGNTEPVPMPYVTETTRLVALLPVMVDGQSQEDASRFLKDFARECLEKQDNTILVVVLVIDGEDSHKKDQFQNLKDLVVATNNKYQSEGAKVSWLALRTGSTPPATLAILDLIGKKFSADTLFVMCRPGMEIRVEYLNRVRMNTIAGWQVFFPIPFVQYHPAVSQAKERGLHDTSEISKDHGHFDSHLFDHFAFYNSDYQTARKATEKQVPIVRHEREARACAQHGARTGHDVYRTFLHAAEVHVMRAVEPLLWIRNQTAPPCQPEMESDSRDHCLASRAQSLGSRSQLATLLFQYEDAKGHVSIDV